MRRPKALAYKLLIINALVFTSRMVARTASVGAWTPIYQSIDYATATIDGPDGSVALRGKN